MVLNICNEGMLLLAWLKKTGGTFDVDAIPLKNLNSDGLPALMNVGLLPRYDFMTVCGITVWATFELLDRRCCVVGTTNPEKKCSFHFHSINSNVLFICELQKGKIKCLCAVSTILPLPLWAGKALAAMTTCFGELADGKTGKGFRYCVTGGWSPLICRSICALWWAICAICALFVASKLPMLINCGAAAGIATGCHGGYNRREDNKKSCKVLCLNQFWMQEKIFIAWHQLAFSVCHLPVWKNRWKRPILPYGRNKTIYANLISVTHVSCRKATKFQIRLTTLATIATMWKLFWGLFFYRQKNGCRFRGVVAMKCGKNESGRGDYVRRQLMRTHQNHTHKQKHCHFTGCAIAIKVACCVNVPYSSLSMVVAATAAHIANTENEFRLFQRCTRMCVCNHF